MLLKLDVGASAYWSEIASSQTLDNLLAAGQISLEEYSSVPGPSASPTGGLRP